MNKTDHGFQNDLDNKLFEAIVCGNIDEINRYVDSGANINAVDKYDDNMIIKYLQSEEHEANIEIIKCLVELGINTNYEGEGFNCLFYAYLANRADIVEYLLKAGTSAQCISTDSCETLLDWIEWDVVIEKDEARVSVEWIAESEKIIQLLKDHGATNADKCFSKTVEEYLKMFGGGSTGLFTKKGHISIYDLPNVTNEMITNFNQWKENAVFFTDKTWNREEINIEKLIECNNFGLEIIKSIKKLLPGDIKVQFNYIIPEDYRKNKVTNINELII